MVCLINGWISVIGHGGCYCGYMIWRQSEEIIIISRVIIMMRVKPGTHTHTANNYTLFFWAKSWACNFWFLDQNITYASFGWWEISVHDDFIIYFFYVLDKIYHQGRMRPNLVEFLLKTVILQYENALVWVSPRLLTYSHRIYPWPCSIQGSSYLMSHYWIYICLFYMFSFSNLLLWIFCSRGFWMSVKWPK